MSFTGFTERTILSVAEQNLRDHASQNGGKSEVEREHLPCQNACDCRRKICRSGGTAHFGQLIHHCQNLPFEVPLLQAKLAASLQ